MEINQLVYLVAIVEEASFSRAADRLGVAQPSISQQIKKLEDEVGTPLLDRLPRKVVPTAAGERLLEHARRILAELADARRRLNDSSENVSGTLKVGAIPTIAPYLLPDVLKHFSSRFPEVHVDVVEDVTARLASLVEQGELDLAILSNLDGGPTLHVETIGKEPLHLLLPRSHRLVKKKNIPWSELTDERFLVLHEMHCLSGQVSHVCQRRKLRPNVVMRGAQLSTIAEMVSAGLGISVVPEMMARHDKNAARISLPFAGEEPTRDICLAWSLLRYRTQAARAMEQTIRQRL